jgi:hypothetical protein
VKAFGLTIVFEGAACRVVPFGDPIELDERLAAFCRAILADPNVASCVAGLHGHPAGDCARK